MRSSRRRKRWAISSPVLSDGFRYPLPLGSAFGSEKSSIPKWQLIKTKLLEIRRFRGVLVRREGFEPPAFWSVGCLKAKSEPFRLRFARFSTIRSADFPLFPFSPACANPILGQKWVRADFSVARVWIYSSAIAYCTIMGSSYSAHMDLFSSSVLSCSISSAVNSKSKMSRFCFMRS